MNALTVVNSLGICALIVVLIIIIFKYNERSVTYNNLHHMISLSDNKLVTSEKNPLYVNMNYI